MGLFRKHCEACGTQVTSLEFIRFGKHFCSEDHANKYAAEMENGQLGTTPEEGSGCC
jgi:hypothetical protein